MMLIENDFNVGDIVFLKTDSGQSERIVTGIQINKNGLLYRLACGNVDSWHYAIEISISKDILKTTTGE